MSTKNNHIIKAIGLSLLITIFVFFNMSDPEPIATIYLLFVPVAAFISIYFISIITSKAYHKFEKSIGR
ncbi:hypothetical protein [Rossellomorea aquimaris]|uniref:Uncharacterized protein n=1 Tax=Rossellomorea aquimaris TaxID=189382 RepID=A0A1J6W4Y5_9BACI|nr:hypothetical protein [Rossellomorea aquimaris]OIU71660.1 hypothetical protein BHE18_03055 [Rossellomorea aquimaris]